VKSRGLAGLLAVTADGLFAPIFLKRGVATFCQLEEALVSPWLSFPWKEKKL